MMFPSRDLVNNIKEKYPKGTRVILNFMDDRHAPPTGTHGTVRDVDDMGTVHIIWDNGSCLGACVLDGDSIKKEV